MRQHEMNQCAQSCETDCAPADWRTPKCEAAPLVGYERARNLPASRAAWLFREDNAGAMPIAPEGRCWVLNYGLSSDAAGSLLLPQVLRPTLVWASDHDACCGQGWVMDASNAGVPREMRYVVQAEAGGAVSTWMSIVHPEGGFMLAWFLLMGTGRELVCAVEHIGNDGAAVQANELHVLLRQCQWCPNNACSCAPETELSSGTCLSNLDGSWTIESGLPLTVTIAHSRGMDQIREFQDYLLQYLLATDDQPEPCPAELSFSSMEDSDFGEFDATILDFVTTEATACTSHHHEPCHEPCKAHNPPARRTYPCNVCGRVFKQSGHRNEHQRRMHFNEGYKCPKCPRQFGVPSKLQRHIRAVHENIRTLPCHLCGQKFKEKSHLAQHLRRHQKCTNRLSASANTMQRTCL